MKKLFFFAAGFFAITIMGSEESKALVTFDDIPELQPHQPDYQDYPTQWGAPDGFIFGEKIYHGDGDFSISVPEPDFGLPTIRFFEGTAYSSKDNTPVGQIIGAVEQGKSLSPGEFDVYIDEGEFYADGLWRQSATGPYDGGHFFSFHVYFLRDASSGITTVLRALFTDDYSCQGVYPNCRSGYFEVNSLIDVRSPITAIPLPLPLTLLSLAIAAILVANFAQEVRNAWKQA